MLSTAGTLEGPFDIANANASAFVAQRAADAGAEAQLTAQLSQQAGTGLFMEAFKYFSALRGMPDLQGRQPDLVFTVPNVSFPAASAPFYPFASVPGRPAVCAGCADAFQQFVGGAYTARWAARLSARLLVPRSGTHVFHMLADDGGRLWLDGALVVQTAGEWRANRTAWGQAHLRRGWHALVVEYYQDGGGQGLEVTYSEPGKALAAPAPLPTGRLFLPAATAALALACPLTQERATPGGAAGLGPWGPGVLAPSDGLKPEAVVCWGLYVPSASAPDGFPQTAGCDGPCVDAGAGFVVRPGARSQRRRARCVRGSFARCGRAPRPRRTRSCRTRTAPTTAALPADLHKRPLMYSNTIRCVVLCTLDFFTIIAVAHLCSHYAF